MRNLFVLLSLLFLPAFSIYAKNPVGIEPVKLYADYDGFRANNYVDSFGIGSTNRVREAYWWLTVTKGGQKQRYKNGTLWGYANGDTLHRYYDEHTTLGAYGYYRVIDTSGLVVYTKEERGGYRMSGTAVSYYYSKGLNAPLRRLRLNNLQADFPNQSFAQQIAGLKNLGEKDKDGRLKVNVIYQSVFRQRI
ncbi:MAG: hypothetical protein QM642_10975 [Edaphocola sp.]